MVALTKRTMIVAMIAGSGGLAVAQPPLPAHPNDIVYPSLAFEVPAASQFREVLSNGMVVYIAEDRMLPTFDMSITLRTGSAVEPPGKAGLAALVGQAIRDGGTKGISPEDLDERIAFLAASMNTSIGETRGRAGLSLLSKDIDEGLALFIEMLRYPKFNAKRLQKAKDRQIQNMKRRNDSTASISGIEWGFLMDGDAHFSNRYPTSETIASITRDDLFAFHQRYIHPGNMIVAVSGDFDRKTMLAKLEKAFAGWQIGETGPTTFDKPAYTPTPGVYLIHKEGVNQGRIAIGHKSVERGSPDEFAITVMNGILGASGFRSRLVARIRSDEGLAYNCGSRFGQGVYYPSSFQCYLQSKSNSCAFATQIVLEELERLRNELVPQADVDATVAYYTESFPQRFSSKMALLGTYVADEYSGRDPAYWRSYVRNLKQVTPADVQRVAKKYLHPDQLVILAVGDAGAILAGGHDKAPDLRFDVFGKLTRLPLRDADTLKR